MVCISFERLMYQLGRVHRNSEDGVRKVKPRALAEPRETRQGDHAAIVFSELEGGPG